MDVETSSFDVGTYAFGSGAESIHTYGLITLCQDDGAILEPWRHHDSCPRWPDSKQCQMSYIIPGQNFTVPEFANHQHNFTLCPKLNVTTITYQPSLPLPLATSFFCLRLVFTSLKTLVLLVGLAALRVRGYTFCSNWLCSSFWECSRCIIPWTSILTLHAPWEIQCIGHVYIWCGFKRATCIRYLYTYHASPWSQSLQKWTSWHKMP